MLALANGGPCFRACAHLTLLLAPRTFLPKYNILTFDTTFRLPGPRAAHALLGIYPQTKQENHEPLCGVKYLYKSLVSVSKKVQQKV